MSVSPHVFSPTVAAVDTKRGYICGYVQRALGTARVWSGVVQNSLFTVWGYINYMCAIRDHQPTAWDGFTRPAETEAKCNCKVSLQIVVYREISKSLYYEYQVRGRFVREVKSMM